MILQQKIKSINQVALSMVVSVALIVGLSNLPLTDAAVTSVAGSDNLILNSQFKATDYGPGTFSSSTGVGNFFNTRWRAKHVYPSSSASLQQISEFSGGTKVTLSNTTEDYFYLRQIVPGVTQFSNKTFTVRADIGNVDSGLLFDFYVNARWNNSEWVSIADTNQSNLTSGTHTATFSVPDLGAYSSFTEAYNNGLEVAFRINSPNPQTNAEVDIKSIALYEGSNLSEAPLSDYSEERAELYTYYETAGYSTGVVGLDSSGGQKRATFPMTSPKRRGTNFEFTHFDALGNEGRVSVYSRSGARTDNVKPDSVRHSTNGIIFVFYNSNIAGIGTSWIADSEI